MPRSRGILRGLARKISRDTSCRLATVFSGEISRDLTDIQQDISVKSTSHEVLARPRETAPNNEQHLHDPFLQQYSLKSYMKYRANYVYLR